MTSGIGRQLRGQALAAVVVPLVAYLVFRQLLGAGTPALAIACAIPIAWMAAVGVARRRLEPVALLAVVLYLAALAVGVLTGGGSLALKLRDAVLTGALGFVCLGSLAVGRPLLVCAMPVFGRLRPEARERMAAACDPERVRHVLTVATGILGVTMALDCASQVVMALTLPTTAFPAATGVTRPAILAAGAAALLLYARSAGRGAGDLQRR
jgi:hypothetical protein